MRLDEMRDDEFKPACPKCSGINFVAVNNRSVFRAEKAIVMITCADLQCQTVIGVLPASEVWPE